MITSLALSIKKTEDNFVYKWLPCAKKSQSSLSITLNLYIQKAINCLHNFYAYQTNLLINLLLWKIWMPQADTPIITGCPSASWNVFKTIVWGASSIFPSPNNQTHSKVEVWVHQSVRSKIIGFNCDNNFTTKWMRVTSNDILHAHKVDT